MAAVGDNRSGQLCLANQGLEFAHTPVLMAPPQHLPRVTAVACGLRHTAVLVEGGAVWTCGEASYGRLGLGPTVVRGRVPSLQRVRVTAPGGGPVDVVFSHIACGVDFTVAAGAVSAPVPGDAQSPGADWLPHAPSDSDRVFAWGSGVGGRLGTGREDDETSPCPALFPCGAGTDADASSRSAAPLRVASLACGGHHTALVASDGAVFTWGDGGDGRLGHMSQAAEWAPRRVARLQGAVAVACGVRHTVALDCHGEVFTWGCGVRGQLGHGDRKSCPLPVRVHAFVASRTSIATVFAGADATAARDEAGVLWACGARGGVGAAGGDACSFTVLSPPRLDGDAGGGETEAGRGVGGGARPAEGTVAASGRKAGLGVGWRAAGRLGRVAGGAGPSPAGVGGMLGRVVETVQVKAAEKEAEAGKGSIIAWAAGDAATVLVARYKSRATAAGAADRDSARRPPVRARARTPGRARATGTQSPEASAPPQAGAAREAISEAPQTRRGDSSGAATAPGAVADTNELPPDSLRGGWARGVETDAVDAGASGPPAGAVGPARMTSADGVRGLRVKVGRYSGASPTRRRGAGARRWVASPRTGSRDAGRRAAGGHGWAASPGTDGGDDRSRADDGAWEKHVAFQQRPATAAGDSCTLPLTAPVASEPPHRSRFRRTTALEAKAVSVARRRHVAAEKARRQSASVSRALDTARHQLRPATADAPPQCAEWCGRSHERQGDGDDGSSHRWVPQLMPQRPASAHRPRRGIATGRNTARASSPPRPATARARTAHPPAATSRPQTARSRIARPATARPHAARPRTTRPQRRSPRPATAPHRPGASIKSRAERAAELLRTRYPRMCPLPPAAPPGQRGATPHAPDEAHVPAAPEPEPVGADGRAAIAAYLAAGGATVHLSAAEADWMRAERDAHWDDAETRRRAVAGLHARLAVERAKEGAAGLVLGMAPARVDAKRSAQPAAAAAFAARKARVVAAGRVGTAVGAMRRATEREEGVEELSAGTPRSVPASIAEAEAAEAADVAEAEPWSCSRCGLVNVHMQAVCGRCTARNPAPRFAPLTAFSAGRGNGKFQLADGLGVEDEVPSREAEYFARIAAFTPALAPSDVRAARTGTAPPRQVLRVDGAEGPRTGTRPRPRPRSRPLLAEDAFLGASGERERAAKSRQQAVGALRAANSVRTGAVRVFAGTGKGKA